jgi:hypothetical protein
MDSKGLGLLFKQAPQPIDGPDGVITITICPNAIRPGLRDWRTANNDLNLFI